MKKILFICMAICISMAANAQKITVTGTVTDATDGEPIIGCAVIEMGTTNGTITDFDGHYIITVNRDAILEYDAIGYLVRHEDVNGRRIINIELNRDSDDIIIVWPQTADKGWIFTRETTTQEKNG